jgi:hypothetical protein
MTEPTSSPDMVEGCHVFPPSGMVEYIKRELNHCAPFRWSQFLLNPHDAGEPASLTRVKHLQLGNAIVGTAKPPTKLAVDILHHHHIRIDVGLVAPVEFSGRELVQHGWALRDDGG